MLTRRIPSVAVYLPQALPWRRGLPHSINTRTPLEFHSLLSFFPKTCLLSFCSASQFSSEVAEPTHLDDSSKRGPLKPGALRVLKSANVILSEDTRHSGKLLQHFSIKTPLLSFHKFNESQREQTVLKRLKEGEIVALICDAGTPGISDPGTELVRQCVNASIPVVPIPGPSAVIAALSASGLSTDEFTFVGFVPKHAASRRERLMVSANEEATQIFYFWRGTLAEAKEYFSLHQTKGEITLLIEGKLNSEVETPSESQLEKELEELISSGHRLSMAVKLVAIKTSASRKTVYSIALRRFGNQLGAENDSCK
ncbi:rsmI, partial [Cucurbita argyrosperma subsp. argyrosperma]